MKVREKVQALLDRHGWTQAKLADALGVSQPTVNRWLSGSDPRGETRDRINELYSEATAPSDHISNFMDRVMGQLRELNPQLDQERIERLLKEAGPSAFLANEPAPASLQPSLTYTAVPLISWVSAGALTQPEVPVPNTDEFPPMYAPDLDPNGDWIALRVDGDSMNRISPHDSIIFVDRRDRRLVPNACYIIGDGEGGATYKRYRPPSTWEPVSTNKEHQPMKLPVGVSPDIIGRVRKTILAM